MKPLIQALAIARLTRLIAQDEITQPVREAVARLDDKHQSVVTEKLAYLVSCTQCVSVWAAGAVLLGSRYRWAKPIVGILAGSQAALLALSLQDAMENA